MSTLIFPTVISYNLAGVGKRSFFNRYFNLTAGQCCCVAPCAMLWRRPFFVFGALLGLCSWAGVALGALAVSRNRPGAGRSVVVVLSLRPRWCDACAVTGDKPWAGAALVRVLAVLDVVAA